MTKEYKKSLFIFRRDLRLNDNTGLITAHTTSEKVVPIFIFTPEQVTDKNKYRSLNAIQFMIESLQDLEGQLKKKKAKLYLFYGNPETVVSGLIKKEKIDAVFVNHDYTPYGKRRDNSIKRACKKNKAAFVSSPDLLLLEPDQALKKNKQPYTIFTPFYKNASKHAVALPTQHRFSNFFTGSLAGSQGKSIYTKFLAQENDSISVHGGRSKALNIFKRLSTFRLYDKERNIPAREATTGLSAHLKFGTISVREAREAIIKKLGKTHTLIKQLYWRDFFTHIAFHFPHVFGHAFHKKYDKLAWKNSKKLFHAWQQGKTGYPLVDAGMRQLAQTGFMHNRVRMVVASFLVKDLHIDWRWGEKHFAQLLVDYDPSVNNGNWQWAASTGCDAQPYFRIFSPWLQQKKFDHDCKYIKTWVEELKNVEPKYIHNWDKYHDDFEGDYPAPIVEHGAASTHAKSMYKKRS
ncbi:MAG: deoxyribodipyrimidine photo-lyase [Epsilonproteobacteria bacterium]|nr:deoxyribodipyrimidine photo-lyase [Campylobacterota bacterium]